MERFNDYIASNRKLFDDEELLEGHMDRFQLKMKQRNDTSLFRVTVTAAASVVLILALTATLGLINNRQYLPDFANAILGSKDTSSQIYDLDNYYYSQLLRKYKAIEKLAYNSDPTVKPEVKLMIDEFELEKMQLQSDLSQNPRKEYVVSAIVQSYQVRMEALDRIQESLAEKKQ